MVHRQELELRGACAQDEISRGRSLVPLGATAHAKGSIEGQEQGILPKLHFRHGDVFTSALQFDAVSSKLVGKYLQYHRECVVVSSTKSTGAGGGKDGEEEGEGEAAAASRGSFSTSSPPSFAGYEPVV
jgi:hypothetical protein